MLKKAVLFFLTLSLAGLAAAAPPTVDAFKQVLNARLQKLKPDDMSERQVLFQDVRLTGSSGNSYEFTVTAVIRDYGTGYPKNRYYGNTCTGRYNQLKFTMLPSITSNEWDVQGAMTPSLDTKQCKPNPAEGVSGIPLASLQGTLAPAGMPPAPNGGGAAPAAAASAGGGSGIAAGSYECWGNGQARMLMNFTARAPGQYIGSDGKPGAYSFDAASQRISFKGGSLDGVMPDGYFAIYQVRQGVPTVSFQSPRGGEVSFCQKAH